MTRKYYVLLSAMTIAVLAAFFLTAHMGSYSLLQSGGVKPGGSAGKAPVKVLVFSPPKSHRKVFEDFYRGLSDGNVMYDGNIDIHVYDWKESTSLSRKEYELRIAQSIQPDYVICSAVDPSLAAAGIPAVFYDGDIKDANRFAYVGTDNYKAGNQAAMTMLAASESGNIHAAIFMPAGRQVFQNRAEGFRAAAKENSRLTVDDEYQVNENYSQFHEHIAKLLEESPEINAFFCEDSLVAGSAAQYLEETGMAQAIILIAMDYNEYTSPYLNDGTIRAALDQDYYQAGKDAINILVNQNRMKIPVDIYHDCKVITADTQEVQT